MKTAIDAGEDKDPIGLGEATGDAEPIGVADEPTNAPFEEDFTLRWEDVKSYARPLFKVWWDGSELQWAQTAWEHIVAAGHAHGEMGKEYCQARLRFLALATFYCDWCSVATDEDPELQLEEYIEALNLNPFYLGLMLEADYDLDDKDEHDWPDEKCALANAFRELVRRERPLVARVLLEAFGGPSSLFISLWRSRYPLVEQESEPLDCSTDGSIEPTKGDATPEGVGHTPSSQGSLWDSAGRALPEVDEEDEEYDNDGTYDDEQDEALLSDDEILNVVTGEKVEAWDWISQGCEAL